MGAHGEAGDPTKSMTDAERARHELEKSRLQSETLFKRIELRHKAAELKIKREEMAQNKGFLNKLTPLSVAIIAALFGFIGNIGVTWLQGNSNREIERERLQFNKTIERQKFESTVITEIIKTGDLEKAKVNLAFYIDAGLVGDPDGKLKSLLSDPSKVPVLPTTNPSGQTPTIAGIPIYCTDHEGRNVVFDYGPVAMATAVEATATNPPMIISNRQLAASVPASVTFFNTGRECARLLLKLEIGSATDEMEADCWIIRTGKAQGFLTEKTLPEIIDFLKTRSLPNLDNSLRLRNVASCFEKQEGRRVSTKCHFNKGPRAGATQDYSPLPPISVGALCKDGYGSTGYVQ
jgi:hypothetical protein